MVNERNMINVKNDMLKLNLHVIDNTKPKYVYNVGIIDSPKTQ